MGAHNVLYKDMKAVYNLIQIAFFCKFLSSQKISFFVLGYIKTFKFTSIKWHPLHEDSLYLLFRI